MFGNRLKELRKANNYTMDELANIYNAKFKGGLNKGTISKYENEKQEPMISVVNNLAELFDVPTDYLLGRMITRGNMPDVMKPFFRQNKSAPIYFESPDDSLSDEEIKNKVEAEIKSTSAYSSKYDFSKMLSVVPEEKR